MFLVHMLPISSYGWNASVTQLSSALIISQGQAYSHGQHLHNVACPLLLLGMI